MKTSDQEIDRQADRQGGGKQTDRLTDRQTGRGNCSGSELDVLPVETDEDRELQLIGVVSIGGD